MPAKRLPGISVIIHSCDPGSPTTEDTTPDGSKAYCPGTQKFLNNLVEIFAKRQYSWIEFFAKYEPQLLTQISSLPYSKWKKYMIFAPKSLYEEYSRLVSRYIS